MKIINLVGASIMASLLFVGCATSSEKASMKNMAKANLNWEDKASGKVKKLIKMNNLGVVDANYLKSKLYTGIVVVDARPSKVFKKSHIPTAINIPDKKFDKFYPQMEKVSKSTEVIVYCGGWKCAKSPKVAGMLKVKGFKNLKVYQEGLPAWKKKGNKLEKATKKVKKSKDYVIVNGIKLVKAQEDNEGMVYGPFFLDMIKNNNSDIVVVDVRDKEEFEEGHLTNTINIPLEGKKEIEFVKEIAQLNKQVILMCSSGARSTEAMTAVMENGGDIKNIFYVDALIECDKNNKCKIEINDPV